MCYILCMSVGRESTHESAELLEEIGREARRRLEADRATAPVARPWQRPILAVNAVLVAVTVLAGVLTTANFRARAGEVVRLESRFVTTEWRILQELQQRTDRALQDKDREIALLRQLRSAVRGREGFEDEEARIRAQLQQAYAQREAILQARISAPDEALGTLIGEVDEASDPVVTPESLAGLESELDGLDAAPEERGALRAEPGEEGRADGPTVDSVALSRDDPQALAWYRRTIDDLRLGLTSIAQQRLENDVFGAGRLTPADYDRLLGLTTIVERQQTYLAVVDSLEQQLAERERELGRERSRLEVVRADLESAEREVARLELAVRDERREGLAAREELTRLREDADQVRREVERLAVLLAAETGRATRLQESVEASEVTLAELRIELERTSDLSEQTRAELEEARRTIDQRTRELAGVRAELRDAGSELAAARDEIVRLREEVIVQSETAGRRATSQTYTDAELLLDYLAGVDVEDADSVRAELRSEWESNSRFRELVTRAQRLGEAGIDPDRADLPSSRLVGVVTDLSDVAIVAEVLTDVAAQQGDTVEFRSRQGIQPGRLIAQGRVEAAAGDTLVISLVDEHQVPSLRDLVYRVESPEY